MVAPRGETFNSDGWGLFKSEDLEEGLRKSLRELINLPTIDKLQSPEKRDLVFEMVVVNYRGGEFDGLNGGDIFIPIFWRPMVEVKARLYNFISEKTVHIAHAKVKVPWKTYLSRAVSLNGIFRFKPLFGSDDMEVMLCKATIDVLEKLTKKL